MVRRFFIVYFVNQVLLPPLLYTWTNPYAVLMTLFVAPSACILGDEVLQDFVLGVRVVALREGTTQGKLHGTEKDDWHVLKSQTQAFSGF